MPLQSLPKASRLGQSNWRLLPFIMFEFLLLMSLAAWATAKTAPFMMWADRHVRPPTVDPTYGLKLPAIHHLDFGATPSWIWAAHVANKQTIYLQKSLQLRTVPSSTRIYVTADDSYRLYINGKHVLNSPSSTDTWKRVQRANISTYLKPGRNILAIRATNDTGPAGVLLWLLNGHKTLLKSDGSWHVASAVTPTTEWITSAPQRGWKLATVEAPWHGGPWSAEMSPWPITVPGAMAHLYFQPTNVIVLHGLAAFSGLSTLTGKGPVHLTIHPPAHGTPPELLLDFGREMAGCMQVRGKNGTVLVGTGESRGEAVHRPWGGVHALPLVRDMTQSTPYSAFRYVAVSFRGPETITLNRLRLNFKYSPVQYHAAFSCSSPLLTKIWYTSAYTTHLCMQEQIWDAPKRDRAMWMGDLQISGQVINNVFLNRRLMELTMRELRLQAQGGRPPTALPANDVNGIPGYSCAWICGLSDFYRHTGAINYVRSQHQLLLSMLRYMQQAFNKHNIFVNRHRHWCFVDWANKLNGNTAQAYMATDLYTCLAVRRAVFLLRAMGDNANARKYAHWDKQLIAAARKYLANPTTHTYTSLRQVNAMAVYSGVAAPQQRRAIFKTILGPSCSSWKQIATPYYNNFVLFALSDLGRTQQAINFVRAYWGGMIREGATTFWEAYDPSWPKKHFHKYLRADNGQGYFVSLCHGWSSGVTNWLTEEVLGVQARTGGFTHARIVPHLGNLMWARGRVPTPRGNIQLWVKKAHHGEGLDLVLPRNVTATVGLPGNTILVNGKAITIIRHTGKRSYIHVVGPGHWTILSK